MIATAIAYVVTAILFGIALTSLFIAVKEVAPKFLTLALVILAMAWACAKIMGI